MVIPSLAFLTRAEVKHIVYLILRSWQGTCLPALRSPPPPPPPPPPGCHVEWRMIIQSLGDVVVVAIAICDCSVSGIWSATLDALILCILSRLGYPPKVHVAVVDVAVIDQHHLIADDLDCSLFVRARPMVLDPHSFIIAAKVTKPNKKLLVLINVLGAVCHKTDCHTPLIPRGDLRHLLGSSFHLYVLVAMAYHTELLWTIIQYD